MNIKRGNRPGGPITNKQERKRDIERERELDKNACTELKSALWERVSSCQ